MKLILNKKEREDVPKMQLSPEKDVRRRKQS